MKNEAYWKKRFEALEDEAHRAAQATIQDMDRIIRDAQKELESQIAVWYNRFADNNNISMAEAKRLLKTQELAEFKWDVEQYIQYGEENAINGKWIKQLENASARFHISRLEALQYQTHNTVEKLFGKYFDMVDSHMKKQYLDTYYHGIYEVQKGLNTGWDFAAIDERKLDAIMNKPWTTDNRTFSDRIWRDKDKLTRELHDSLTQGIILGKPSKELIGDFAKKMGTTRNNAASLLNTESSYFSALAAKDAYNEMDVEQYKILSTLDSRTSEICRGMDGKIFDLKDFEPGVTANPFHVRCRTTTIPYFDDNYGERAARDKDGKVYYVPDNISYPDWKEIYVDKTKEPPADQNSGWQGIKNTPSYTKKEAVERFKSAYGIDFTDSRKYPINEELLSDCVRWIDSFADHFPGFAENNPVKIPAINVLPPSKIKGTTYGYYSFYKGLPKVEELALNGVYHSKMERIDEAISKIGKNKHFVANFNRKSVFIHEYGHHVSNSMRWITGNANWQEEFLKDVISDFKKTNQTFTYDTYAGLTEYVSRYGSSSWSELFAECFSEYFGGENPREFATIFGRKLELVLKGVK